MITTTMGMFDWVHGNTTHLGPRVSLGLVLVVSATGLQDGLVNTSTTSDDADHGSVRGLDHFLGARGKLDTGFSGVGVVGDNGGVVARGASQLAAIANLLFQVADNGTFGHGSNWKHIADLQVSLSTGVNKLASVHAFYGDEQLLAKLVLVWVSEDDDSQWGTTAGVVDDFLDDSLDVSIALGEVDGSELGCSLAVLVVALEDRSSTFTLSSDDSSHFGKKDPTAWKR